MEVKYVLVELSGIYTQIAKKTNIPDYTVGVIETFFPDEEEIKLMTKKQEKAWIKENNHRMEAICKFMNENFK